VLGQNISAAEYSRLVSRPPESTVALLAIDQRDVRDNYNRRPFLISHRLVDHPAFQLPELSTLIRRLPREQVVCRLGRMRMDSDFDDSFNPGDDSPRLDSALEDIEGTGAYIYVRNPECDPEYRPLIERLLAEVAWNTRNIDPQIRWYSAYLFISAFDSTTPYHMDREMNFLLQIRGEKTVLLWDQNDPDVMTHAQKDALLAYAGRRPQYSDGIVGKAQSYLLRPGQGVHHPFIAPHIVHTASSLSISLALTFRTRQSDTWTGAHRFNHRMRRIGLSPEPVGRSWFRDVAKAHGMAFLSASKQLVAAERWSTRR
jgi:hypothetical protein